MVDASCHCGAVTISVETAPEQLTSCNCSICRRLGTLWCYFDPSTVHIAGPTSTYRWGDKSIDLHHCTTCGCTTHWAPVDPTPNNRMGINARLMAPEVVAAARVRRLDGADTWEFLD
jgi:hypothetical protein